MKRGGGAAASHNKYSPGIGSFPWRFKKAAYALMNLCACMPERHHRISNDSVFRSLSTPSRLLQTMCIYRAVPCRYRCPSICGVQSLIQDTLPLSRHWQTESGAERGGGCDRMSDMVVTAGRLSSWLVSKHKFSSGRWKSSGTYINIANGDTATHFDWLIWFSWGEIERGNGR